MCVCVCVCVFQVELEQMLQESQYTEQQLELTNNSLKRHLNQITEEKEEREKEAVSCFNALEVNIPLFKCTKSFSLCKTVSV